MEEKKIKITSKGQLTLPAGVRKELNIHKGDVLTVTSDGKRIVMEVGEKRQKTAPPAKGIVKKTAGIWKDRESENL